MFLLMNILFYQLLPDQWKETIAPIEGGSICKIKHIATGRILVWKQLAFIKGSENDVEQEVQIRKKISSPYLVPILDWFVEEGFLYIVMEYYEEGTLQDTFSKLKKRGETMKEAVFLFFSYLQSHTTPSIFSSHLFSN
jgi:serine/threonine protein kinase